MTTLLQTASGELAAPSALTMGFPPLVGDIVRVSGSSFQVLRRRFILAEAPDANLQNPQWTLLLTVAETADDSDPIPAEVINER